MRCTLVVLAMTVLLAGCAAQPPPGRPQIPRRSQNLIFVMTDGLRWQEVFRGAQRDLLEEEHKGVYLPAIRQRFWRDTPEQRRAALLPFFWTVIATQGQVYGDQDHGSIARVTNGFNFSYPGYSEALCGVADPRMDENARRYNPNINVLEWLNRLPEYHGRVAAFCSWDLFPYILNAPRSGLLVDAGYRPLTVTGNSTRMELLNRLMNETPQLGEETRYDAFTFHAAREYLIAHKPRVLYLSFDETDEQGHQRRYDRVLSDAHKVDGYLRELWELVQSMPQYRGKTTLVFSTDHGRGDSPTTWKDHGQKLPASEYIWLAIMGPDTPPLGVRHDIAPITQSQIAATLAAVLGEDYRAAVPNAAPPIADAVLH